MALQINFNYNINYSLEREITYKEQLGNILTEEQFNSLENIIVKTFNIANVYCKIDSFTGDKDLITINVGYYKDSTKAVKINNKTYSFVPNIQDTSGNFIKQGYEYLKTLDEFKDAVDLLDEGQTV